MAGKEMLRMEEVQIGGDEKPGALLMTVGKLLLWTDLIFLSFVYSGIKGGSYLYVYWALVQGTIGLILLIVGSIKRGPLTD
jgi:hypothetical protein